MKSRYQIAFMMEDETKIPSWQYKRGERYGNRRKQVARLKVKSRRILRAKNNRIDYED